MKYVRFDDQYFVQPIGPAELARLSDWAFKLIIDTLDKHGIPREEYILGVPDADANGRICFHEENGIWVYYVSEKGRRFQGALFSSVADGMNYLVWSLLGDPKNNNSNVGRLPKLQTPSH